MQNYELDCRSQKSKKSLNSDFFRHAATFTKQIIIEGSPFTFSHIFTLKKTCLEPKGPLSNFSAMCDFFQGKFVSKNDFFLSFSVFRCFHVIELKCVFLIFWPSEKCENFVKTLLSTLLSL